MLHIVSGKRLVFESPKELFPRKMSALDTCRPGMASEASGKFFSGYC